MPYPVSNSPDTVRTNKTENDDLSVRGIASSSLKVTCDVVIEFCSIDKPFPTVRAFPHVFYPVCRDDSVRIGHFKSPSEFLRL